MKMNSIKQYPSYDGRKITFRLDDYKAEKLKEVAKNNYLSVSAYIRKSVDEALRKEDNKIYTDLEGNNQ